MKKTDVDHTRVVSDLITSLLQSLGFGPDILVQVKYDQPSDSYQVLLQTEKPSLVIGFHGDNLSAMQLILGQMVYAATSQWLNISLNVNDYRERREFTLHSLADTAVSRVIATGQSHSLPSMPSSERRIIHLYLQNHPYVETSSQGMGKNRCIIVSPKSA